MGFLVGGEMTLPGNGREGEGKGRGSSSFAINTQWE